MSRVFVAVESVCKLLAAAGLLALLAFAAATLANGVSRSLFSYPIDFIGDAGSLIVAASVASCFPIALWSKSNIRIDLLGAFLPAWAHRGVEVFADAGVLVVTAAVARQIFIYARNDAQAGDSTAMLEIETAPFWFYVAAMLAVAAFVQAVVSGRGLAALLARSPQRPRPPGH